MNGKRQHRLRTVLRGGVAIVTLGISGVTFAGSAAADATDDYPIPHRMIITTCTAEEILPAAKDFTPIYYQRYIIDKHNRPPEVQHAAIDNAHHVDDDTNFANQLHTYGIYGPPDYNALLAKIVCDRLRKGVDANAFESSHFLAANFPRGTTQVQTWQFVATAISHYCPDQTTVLENVAAQGR